MRHYHCLQAQAYGEQVRLLEDAGLEADRARIRKAWTAFRKQFEGTVEHEIVRVYYWDAYMN